MAKEEKPTIPMIPGNLLEQIKKFSERGNVPTIHFEMDEQERVKYQFAHVNLKMVLVAKRALLRLEDELLGYKEERYHSE